MLKEMCDKFGEHKYLVFRIIVGVLFLMHGLMKFGFFGGKAIGAFNLFMLAGIFEVIIGPLIILGLFTRIASVIGAIEMFVAFFYMHANILGKFGATPINLNPFTNGGEIALIFFAIFLVTGALGGKKFSADASLGKNEALKKII